MDHFWGKNGPQLKNYVQASQQRKLHCHHGIMLLYVGGFSTYIYNYIYIYIYIYIYLKL